MVVTSHHFDSMTQKEKKLISQNRIFTAFRHKSKSGGGFTLIELLVTVAIFSLIVVAAIGVFVQALKAQRHSLATQALLDQTSYLVEYMSRALRMAKKDSLGTCIDAELNYKIVGNGIKFLNYKDECQKFYLEGNQLKEERGGGTITALTSPSLKVSNFNLNLLGETQNDNLQPRITFFLEIEGKEGAEIRLQTTISQRNPDIKI